MRKEAFLIFVIVLLFCPRVLADQVILRNGDRLTGTILESNVESLNMKSDFAGEVTIQWGAIEQIFSNRPLLVRLKDQRVVVGNLVSIGGNIEIHPNDGSKVTISKEAIASMSQAPVSAPIIKEIPAGTELEIRLKSKVASDSSKPKDRIEAELIAPVLMSNRVAIPAGSKLLGTVKNAKASSKPEERSLLALDFDEWVDTVGKTTKLATKVVKVDNARETVDENGQINGILSSETISSRLDAGLGKLSERNSGLAGILEAAKNTFIKEPNAEIIYPPGVEMTIKLLQSVPLQGNSSSGGIFQEETIDPKLDGLVNAQPFQTMAEKPPKPSDVTNLMFLGSQEKLEAAFATAGWSTAAALNRQSGLETFRAIAENRGYKEAPLSLLLLDEQRPTLVFQKQNNTFAQRHHLRIWKRPDTYQGQDVWVSSATHDIGIEFSPENKTFIHQIDSQIDLERTKVINDLVFTGGVKSLGLVDRPNVPRESSNATGDKLLTDGKMAVLAF